MRTLLTRFFFYISFKLKGGDTMYLCVGIATLILQGKLKFSEVPEGILRDNVKLILTTWGFPQLAVEE